MSRTARMHLCRLCLAAAVFVLTSLASAQDRSRLQRDREPAPSPKAEAKSSTARTFQDNLAASDPLDRFRKESHHKSHTVTLEANRAYRIDLQSSQFDPFLRIEDASGENLLYNDDGGDGLNARLLFLPTKSGQYRLIATSYKGGQTGAYILTVAEYQPAGEEKTQNGMLTKDDPASNTGQHYKIVEKIRLQAGKAYRIDVTSTEFDTFLMVRDSAGKLLSGDDDGAGGLNSRLLFVPKTDDTFEIVVMGFRPGSTGAFRLSIQEYRPAGAAASEPERPARGTR